jgi:hypothetical protein
MQKHGACAEAQTAHALACNVQLPDVGARYPQRAVHPV